MGMFATYGALPGGEPCGVLRCGRVESVVALLLVLRAASSCHSYWWATLGISGVQARRF